MTTPGYFTHDYTYPATLAFYKAGLDGDFDDVVAAAAGGAGKFVATSGSPTFITVSVTEIELGHADDTTLSRSAAGVLAVEGGVLAKENRANVFTQAQQFTTLEIGDASDTTLSRSAAGVLAVEGGVVPKENRANTFTQPQLVSVNGSTTPNTAADDFVVRNQSGMSGMSLIGDNASNTFFMIGTSAADNAFNFYYEGGSGDVIFRTTTNVRLQWDASDTAWRLPNALVVGSPTGGAKGNGTINATAVYDDNTLLSCYPFDAYLDGYVDFVKWDGAVPNREIETRTDDPEKGENIAVETETVVRTHEGARRFADRLGTEHDPLTLDGYAAHWKTKRHLTSMPNEEKFDPEEGLSSGEWIQRLVETVEIQAILIEQLNERLKTLEAD